MASPPKKPRLAPVTDLDSEKLLKGQRMFCWGSTAHGELGLGGIEEETIYTPREVRFPKATQIEQIACGENYSIVLTRDGRIYSCGNNDYGQLGHKGPRKRLHLIPGLDRFCFKGVACGSAHTVAVNEWGQLFSWGWNLEGQLGALSRTPAESTPRIVKDLGSKVVVQIACGYQHVLALMNNGELYSWGSNSDGQLGIGEQDCRFSLKPQLVSSLSSLPIAHIACGGHHSIAVTKSGSVYGWGRNIFGQLGLNSVSNMSFPCRLKTLKTARVRSVSCGEDFTVFLTMDGGVLTCGAGMYGQLGHGTKMNEIMPRQVMELMGTVVTKISCGRRHALALVPAQGRVYAWGLGGAGQLGSRGTQTATTPQIVPGQWVPPNNDSQTIVENDNSLNLDLVIRNIFCGGGDHCFATVTKKKDNIKPNDTRYFNPESQILTITNDQIELCHRIPAGARVSDDLMKYFVTVFKSQACINASFLVDEKIHYGSTGNDHFVDIEQAMMLFEKIAQISSTSIKELILTSITGTLLPSLRSSPSNVESLRLYMSLPLHDDFGKPENNRDLQSPFAASVLRLQPDAQNIVSSWWCKAPIKFFERIILNYKKVVVYLLQQAKINGNEKIMTNSSLENALDLLRWVNQLNKTLDGGLRVPYETFHVAELLQLIDVGADYCSWLIGNEAPPRIYFSAFPFLYDARAKTILLETDQSIQMHLAMDKAANRALSHLFFTPNPGLGNDPSFTQFVVLNVSRDNLVADTLAQLSLYQTTSDLKRPLRVKFHNEEAEDAGGVKKEFLMLLLKEILDPDYGMFKDWENTRTIWFIPESLEEKSMYYLIGVLCGLAIYNFIIIDLPFPLVLYKKLLGESVTLTDLKDVSPTVARSLQNISDYNEPDLEEVFCLHFEITREVFGQHKVYELIPGGSNVPVTINNKKEFVDTYVDYVLNKSIENHFEAFHGGFHKVCGGRVLELFHSHELMAVIVGNENYDWEEFEKNTAYGTRYSRHDPTIILFWQVFHELSLEDKKKFLLFLTGSDRIPIQGMQAIKVTIQPMADERFLPVAHTCFNVLDLPRYQTRERLKYKLLQAIQYPHGFSLV